MQRVTALVAVLALSLPQAACLFRARVRPGYQRAGLSAQCQRGESWDGRHCRHHDRDHKGGGRGGGNGRRPDH